MKSNRKWRLSENTRKLPRKIKYYCIHFNTVKDLHLSNRTIRDSLYTQIIVFFFITHFIITEKNYTNKTVRVKVSGNDYNNRLIKINFEKMAVRGAG